MKKVILYVLVLVVGNAFASAESKELFPMSDITIGMSTEELEEKFPKKEYEMFESDGDKTKEKGLLFYKVPDNEFWDTMLIVIEDSKVRLLSYAYQNHAQRAQNPNLLDHGKMVKNIKPVFRQLKKQLGSAFERKVICRFAGKTEARSAMYVWQREKDVVVFLHTPVALYKNGDIFECQLSIVPSLDLFGDEIATDNLPEDALLWADAMGEETVAFPSRWVYACVVLCALCAMICLIRRKR